MMRPEDASPGPARLRRPARGGSAARPAPALDVVLRELLESLECLVADPVRRDEPSARRHLHHARRILEAASRRGPGPAPTEPWGERAPLSPWDWLVASRDDESVTRDLQRSFL